MIRSQLDPVPEYFDRYINKCDDIELIEAIEASIAELENAPVDKWKALGNKTYAPGKWSVKDILQHISDTERIFSYRALAIARGESQSLPSYNEDNYAKAANAGNRSIESLISELIISHRSIKCLFESFDPGILHKMCRGFSGEYSVASIGFILPGHQRWHFAVISEKYFPLI